MVLLEYCIILCKDINCCILYKLIFIFVIERFLFLCVIRDIYFGMMLVYWRIVDLFKILRIFEISGKKVYILKFSLVKMFK